MEVLDRQQQGAARAFTLAEAVELFRRLRAANDDGDALTVDDFSRGVMNAGTRGDGAAPSAA